MKVRKLHTFRGINWRKIAIARNIKRRPLLRLVEIVRTTNLAKRSAFMSQEKYIGMDVHQATISVAVMDAVG
jgi:hypothetical protein